MFASKVHGAARLDLLSYLRPLYQEGYSCLLRCPSTRHSLHVIIQRPLLLAHITEETYKSEKSEKCEVEAQLILELWDYKPFFKMEESEITKQNVDHVISANVSELEQKILQLWRKSLIQDISLSSCISGSVTLDAAANNDCEYSITRMPVVDATRHLLYTALYHYRREMYNDAISLLQEAETKLQHPLLLYPWTRDAVKYRLAGGDRKPFPNMMKEIVAWPVEIKIDVAIPELRLKSLVAVKHSLYVIGKPPLVFTKFICFLCYHRKEMVHEAQSMLQGLSILVQYDDGYHINAKDKAIPWQILGFCQEMSGDLRGTYQSYRNAFQQKWCPSWVKFASLMRISFLINKRVMGRP